MPTAESRGSAVWHGNLLHGSGTVSTASGVVDNAPTSWANRADRTVSTNGTSPEELISAALASCYSMALAASLTANGTEPETLDVTATSTFETGSGGASIKSFALNVKGTVPNLSAEKFKELAEQAKDGCPVSKALKGNVELTLQASLSNQ